MNDLLRLKSFQVATTSGRTCSGSVTTPLFGATFVDLEPQESNDFHLIVAFGEDVQRFCSNTSILEIKGSVGATIEADVTKCLAEKIEYREFLPRKTLPDMGKVLSSRALFQEADLEHSLES